jgi:hypothetical protein
MDQPGDVVQLLKEIRDLHRDHLAEYKRVSQEALELNRLATETSKKQYQRSIEVTRGFTWALLTLITLSVTANLWILVRLSALK